MKHIIHGTGLYRSYKTAILIKDSMFIKQSIEEHYVEPLTRLGVPVDSLVSFNLHYNPNNKVTVSLIKAWLGPLLKGLDKLGTTTLLVNDAQYFKTLAGKRKADPYFGAVLPCAIKGFEHISVILGVNYGALFHNPEIKHKLLMSLETVGNHINGSSYTIGEGIIHSSIYPRSQTEIANTLKKLNRYPALTCDIETYGLPFNSGIASIGFAWDKHNGTAFQIPTMAMPVLKDFFENYKGILIFHNCTFDIKHLVYAFYMNDMLDTAGMIKGLKRLFAHAEDTKVIYYLATNTTAGNKLSLKDIAFEFAGNYAQDDIDDVTKIPTSILLRYNLIDCLATWFVYDKYKPKMIADNQEQIYNEIMMPSQRVITQMELTGMCLDMNAVKNARKGLSNALDGLTGDLYGNREIERFTRVLRQDAMKAKQLTLKKKIATIDEFKDYFYNPASNPQTAKLLHKFWDFEIIDRTDTGQPAVGGKTLEKHLNSLVSEFNIKPEELG